jgi:hypothetical protein
MERPTPRDIQVSNNNTGEVYIQPLGSNPTTSNWGPTSTLKGPPNLITASTPLPPGPPGFINIGPRYHGELVGRGEGMRVNAMMALLPSGSE